jgi:phosphohistidine swiveling domain-containing protein
VRPTSDVHIPDRLDDRFVAMFYGRFAGNVDVMRRMGDEMPGSSGDAVEEQYFASARPGMKAKRNYGRIPIVLAKLPVAAWRAQRDIHRVAAEDDTWWRRSVATGSTRDLAESRALLAESQRRVERGVRLQTTVSMIGQGLFEQVKRLCAKAGMEALELSLVSADADVHETAMLRAIWEVAHGRRSLDDFLTDHGFHGPAEGQLASRSWREDPTPIEALLAGYRESEAPGSERSEQSGARRAAEAELFGSMGRAGRARAQLTLRLARRFIPLRQVGRSNFLKGYDVGRCMARRIGDELVATDVLDDAEDVFFLTLGEVLGALPSDVRATVKERKAQRDAYLALELPESWVGLPEAHAARGAVDPAAPRSTEDVTGIGGSPGVVEGRVVVVLDPADPDELEDGDVLVCATTDPSWASLFFLVAAVVIDTGGPMSHGAIVARELGIPCVIGTRDGTRRLHTGDQVRVDGAQGTVVVLKHAEQ